LENINRLLSIVGFNMIPGIGRVRLGIIERHFGGLEVAWRADTSEFVRAGFDNGTITAIKQWRPNIEPERELEAAEKTGVSLITADDTTYPTRLREIHDYPMLLYVKGTIESDDELSIAVVGTRKPTIYGRQVTEELSSFLVRSGMTICSGLARGIDTIAHQTALNNKGRTIAVLGSGIGEIYPRENKKLADEITEHGAVISEFPLNYGPKPENFPRRNRILSGISLGTLVTEAGKSSGAVITAGFALEQNREVFAVPGNIFSDQSNGTNRLIQQGAKLVTGGGDIIEEMNMGTVFPIRERKLIYAETEAERRIMGILNGQSKHVDEICRTTGETVATVSSLLAIMELKGLVKQLGGMNYIST
jgi:DNA processing protein